MRPVALPVPEAVPALLTMPQYMGTLASVRELASRGVSVVAAADRFLAPGFWSRHVSRREKCPKITRGPLEMASWLASYGKQNQRSVLYATSDDMAWVIARHADKLKDHFYLYTPPASALASLLDKSALYQVCVSLGVPTPKSWFPRSEAELVRLCDEQQQTLLLKPRAQLFYSGGKGRKIANRHDAVRTWRLYRAACYAPEVVRDFPSLDLPFVQEYEPSAVSGTYSVSGFIDRESGRVIGARASTKLMQTSRVGVGMCFVSSEVEPAALRSITEVAKRVGYFGVFEVEFVKRQGEYLMVDFNPRYYGQMGFDIARGTPTPWLVQLAALGHTTGLAAQVTKPNDAPTFYSDRVAVTWWLAKALLGGAASPQKAISWYRSMHEVLMAGSIDATWRDDDPVPALIEAVSTMYGPLRNPRKFVRSIPRTGDFFQQPIRRPT